MFEKTNGQSVKFHITDFSYKGQRIELKALDKEKINLKELTGMYYDTELKTTYSILIKENNLVITHSRNGESAISAFQPDIFLNNIGAIEITRNDQNKVTGFNLTGQGIRKMRFDKIVGYCPR